MDAIAVAWKPSQALWIDRAALAAREHHIDDKVFALFIVLFWPGILFWFSFSFFCCCFLCTRLHDGTNHKRYVIMPSRGCLHEVLNNTLPNEMLRSSKPLSNCRQLFSFGQVWMRADGWGSRHQQALIISYRYSFCLELYIRIASGNGNTVNYILIEFEIVIFSLFILKMMPKSWQLNFRWTMDLKLYFATKLHFNQIRIRIKLFGVSSDASVEIIKIDTNDVGSFHRFYVVGWKLSEFRLNDQVRSGRENILLSTQWLPVNE